MKIIISPAKKMVCDTDVMAVKSVPVFIEKTEQLKNYMQGLSYAEAKALWNCNDAIAELNFERFKMMDLGRNLTQALLSYDGIQYQSMAPNVFTKKEWDYVNQNLRILSGFYGVLAPSDGVVPYRLEMQAKAEVDRFKNLYDFWGDLIFEALLEDNHCIVNLASKEYSKCVERPLLLLRKRGLYSFPDFKYVTCNFCEYNKAGKLVQKATQAKIARGEMVRFMAENAVCDIDGLKQFDRLGYIFDADTSSDEIFVFIKQ